MRYINLHFTYLLTYLLACASTGLNMFDFVQVTKWNHNPNPTPET